MTKSLLSIIVPIYNEETIIRASLPKIFNLGIRKEVIVIDDGSSDNTLRILEELQSNYKFTLLHQAVNQGKGEAVKRGLKNINGDYFIVCDADLEYSPTDIISLFKEILKTNDEKTAIYGSRFLNHRPHSFHYFINNFLTRLTNWLFKGNLTDMETCFKLVPTQALTQIKLAGKRFEIEVEISAQLLKLGYNIKELPISYNRRNYQAGKKIKARDGLLAIKTLLVEKLFRRP